MAATLTLLFWTVLDSSYSRKVQTQSCHDNAEPVGKFGAGAIEAWTLAFGRSRRLKIAVGSSISERALLIIVHDCISLQRHGNT